MKASVDIPRDSNFERRYKRALYLARRHQATSVVRRRTYGQNGETIVVWSATIDDELLRRYVLN